MKHVVFALITIASSLAFAQQDGSWVVRRLEWTSQDEQNYSDFVRAIGRTKCSNVDECIRNQANPYYGTDPQGVKFYSDCADFPYFLRSYFAWKNELPFGYVSQIGSFDTIERKKNPPPPGTEVKPIDFRYSDLGNYPVARRTLVPGRNQRLDFFAEMTRLQNMISSGTLRMAGDLESKVSTDFYSPALRPGSIRPGTVVYDPNGHVIVIYDVLPDGRLAYFDAHPDNSVTRGFFSSKFIRSRLAQGAGFKNFRPMKLVNAQRSWWGSEFQGGTLVLAKNEEIADFSMVQYVGTNPDPGDWRKGKFIRNGKTLDYHEFVRRSVAVKKINPVDELSGTLGELCEDMQERMESVEVALKNGLHRRPHPTTIPQNIFGSSGDWENFSTPGRDTRLRISIVELSKSLNQRYSEWLRGDFSDMEYSGDDLKRDLLRAFHKTNLECPVSYTNSAGKKVHLGFELAVKRLFRMSFDPYHCPELRWGATHPQELATCRDDADKRAWYDAEQSIRNHLSRDWSASADMTLDVLQSGRYGARQAPDADLRQFLQSLPSKGGQ